MKYLPVLMLMWLGSWSWAQEGTTEEEYKYLTKGYAYQSDMGLDHKKDGYLIQKIYESENKVQFIGMFHSFSGKTKAYLAVIPRADQAPIHLCIPNNAATETIRGRYLADKRKLLSTVALQDQFDEAWRAFFYHQSSSGLSWMKTNPSTENRSIESKQVPKGNTVPFPTQPEMTSKGVPIQVQDYSTIANGLGKTGSADAINEEPVTTLPEPGSTVEEKARTAPKKQVRISGEVQGDLSARTLVKAPIIRESYQSSGKVVIKICVDQTGDVTYAKFTQRGSTTFDSQLKRLALDSVHDAQFEVDSASEQCGFIAFDFK